MTEGQAWIGTAIIILQVISVGWMIYHKYFGCFSKRHLEKEEERISNLVVRVLYRIRQEDTLAQLDHLRRDVKLDDFEEDIA